jgi:hypothetical protein
VGARRRSGTRAVPWIARTAQRGRIAAAVIVISYFAALFAIGGYWQWNRLGVPTPKHGPSLTFVDTRVITSGWDCTRRDIPVLPVNPCGHNGSGVNYPRLWMLPAFLGLGEGSTNTLAICLAVLFLVIAVFVVPRDASAGVGILYGAALCSPAVMFGVHHGNVDLAIFGLVALSLLISRSRLRGLIGADLLLFLAACLKLFPIFAVSAVAREGRRSARLGAVAVAAAFLAYLLATFTYTRAALRNTPQTDYVSFGVRRFSEWIVSGVNGVSPRIAAGVNVRLSMRAWDVAVILAVVALIAIGRKRLRATLAAPLSADRDLDLFWAGASIYVCSYAVMRNWDYRMVFTLLTIPQLVRWAAQRKALAVVTLAALFIALWLDTYWPNVPILNRALTSWDRITRFPPFQAALPLAALAQLVLFSGLLACLFATAPRGLSLKLAPQYLRPKALLARVGRP